MEEIKVKLESIFEIYYKMINNKNLILSEKSILKIYNQKLEPSLNELNSILKDSFLNKIIYKEILKNRIIEKSTLSTFAIENEIIDEKTIDKNLMNLNSLKNKERQKFISILNTKKLLDSYNFPKEITIDEIKYLHKKIFNLPKYNPGNFKASENFVYLDKNTKLIYISPNYIDIEMNKLCEFINNESTNSHPIIKASLIHIYLGLIHPFLDGNGRVIRLLFNKYLSKMFDKPIYLDEQILEDVELYKKNLNSFRESDSGKVDFINYIFALLLKYNISYNEKWEIILNNYVKIFKKFKNKISNVEKIRNLTFFILKNKIFNIKMMMESLNITRSTAIKYAKLFLEFNFYQEEKLGKENIYYRSLF